MKFLVRLAFVLFILQVHLEAQILLRVPDPQRLQVGGYAQGPVLSPDGRRVAFSREQYNGVEVLDLETNEIDTVCAHLGSGWGMTWLDEKTIVVRSIQEGGSFRNRQMGLEMIDVTKKKETAVVPFAAPNRIEVPRKSSAGGVAIWNKRQLSIINPDRSVLQKRAPQSGEAFASYEEGTILAGAKTIQTPSKRAVLSIAWSPDGTKALVELLGQPSLYVMNRMTGKFQLAASKGEHPSWISNDLYVYMETTDDGHRVVSGEILMASLDGRKQALTKGLTGIAMNPSASADGKVVFNTLDGHIYLIKLGLP